jgi:hypothetical protein
MVFLRMKTHIVAVAGALHRQINHQKARFHRINLLGARYTFSVTDARLQQARHPFEGIPLSQLHAHPLFLKKLLLRPGQVVSGELGQLYLKKQEDVQLIDCPKPSVHCSLKGLQLFADAVLAFENQELNYVLEHGVGLLPLEVQVNDPCCDISSQNYLACVNALYDSSLNFGTLLGICDAEIVSLQVSKCNRHKVNFPNCLSKLQIP